MTKDEMRALLLNDEQMRLMSELLTDEPELRRSLFRVLGGVTTERKATTSTANGRQAKSEEARAKMREGWARRREQAKEAAAMVPRGSRDLDVVDVYPRHGICGFSIASQEWGEFCNGASGFPLELQGVEIPTMQHLYATQMVPDYPDIQREILSMRRAGFGEGRAYRWGRTALWRKDWEDVKFDILRWCLRIKLAQHYAKFSARLLETGDRDIVEVYYHQRGGNASYSPPTWCANCENPRSAILQGRNWSGKLLMELRDEIRGREPDFWRQGLRPPVPGMRLLGRSLDEAISTELYEAEETERDESSDDETSGAQICLILP